MWKVPRSANKEEKFVAIIRISLHLFLFIVAALTNAMGEFLLILLLASSLTAEVTLAGCCCLRRRNGDDDDV